MNIHSNDDDDDKNINHIYHVKNWFGFILAILFVITFVGCFIYSFSSFRISYAINEENR